jgi:hypothetical protein
VVPQAEFSVAYYKDPEKLKTLNQEIYAQFPDEIQSKIIILNIHADAIVELNSKLTTSPHLVSALAWLVMRFSAKQRNQFGISLPNSVQ